MTRHWQKPMLLLAGAWNIAGGLSALFDPAKHFGQLYTVSLLMSDPLQAFFFRCVWINVVAWGAAYALAAYVPAARGAVLSAGGAGKVFYAGACFALYQTGLGKPMLLTAAAVDFVFAALFALTLYTGRKPSS